MPLDPIAAAPVVPRPDQHAGGVTGPAAPGFTDALVRGLEQVSGLERAADALVTDVASGGDTQIHEVMVATTQASIGMDLLVQVRDRALDAYHEIMRLQV